MNFNDWYESYERDGGELMLFNTIDLEAAFDAGMKYAVESMQQLLKKEKHCNEGNCGCSKAN